MGTVVVNGKSVEIGEGERLNCVQAGQRAGVDIPHYCWHPALTVVASCRMCLVETGEKKPDGSIAMGPKLVPGCQTPVKDGMVIVSDSKKVKDSQAQVLEYLLLNHPLDCPTCDQAGECFLQDYSYRFGHAHSRMHDPKIRRKDKDYIGDQITLFTDRCVMCSRCVRFTREISGTAEMQIINRGSHAEIDIFPGMPCNNKLAGNVVDICPVGALCSKDFLYKQRVWWLRSKPSVCPDCSTGCSINVDENDEHVYRLKPRYNPKSQGYFMCDEGRFGFKYVHSPDRLALPVAKGSNGHPANDWSAILPEIQRALSETVLSETAKSSPGKLAAVFSPWMTCEEAFLLAKYLKSLSKDVRLAMGPVRIVGEDDRYPKGVDGQPAEPTTFTIRAEKCPNRLGVAEILKHFEGSVVSFDDLKSQIAGGQIDSLYAVGGDREPWATEADRGWFVETQAARGAGYPALTRKRSGPLRSSRGRLRREGRNVHQSRGACSDDRALRAMSWRSTARRPHPLGTGRPPRSVSCGDGADRDRFGNPGTRGPAYAVAGTCRPAPFRGAGNRTGRLE